MNDQCTSGYKLQRQNGMLEKVSNLSMGHRNACGLGENITTLSKSVRHSSGTRWRQAHTNCTPIFTGTPVHQRPSLISVQHKIGCSNSNGTRTLECWKKRLCITVSDGPPLSDAYQDPGMLKKRTVQARHRIEWAYSRDHLSSLCATEARSCSLRPSSSPTKLHI